MKRFRLKLSSILWLVALAAAFLAGIRYGEHRTQTDSTSMSLYTTSGKVVPLSDVEIKMRPTTFAPTIEP
jgi:hypothetical protein